MLIAHRGYSSKFKDNSLDAFKNALSIGFDMIELDVNVCKSGELVIYHDTIIEYQNIQDCSLEELNKHDIITLDTYFSWNDNRISSYIDVKGNKRVMYSLIQYLQSNTIIDLSKVYIGSFDFEQISILIESKLPVKKGIITSNKPSKYEISMVNKSIEFISFNWEYYDNELYYELNKKNILVFLYTCHNNNENRYIHNNNIKYDGLVSNIFIRK